MMAVVSGRGRLFRHRYYYNVLHARRKSAASRCNSNSLSWAFLVLFDWRQLLANEHEPPSIVDSRRRMNVCMACLAALLAIVLARMTQLEIRDGAAFRRQAARPLERRESLPGVRGRILGRNGAVLAVDEQTLAVAVQYRYLQQPPDAAWLRRTARRRLTPSQRKDPKRLAEEESRIRAERIDLAGRLAELSNVSLDEWNRRARRVQVRVERIADTVNRRRLAAFDARRRSQQTDAQRQTAENTSPWIRLRHEAIGVLRASMDESPPQRIEVEEQLDYHVLAQDVPLAVVAEVEANPDDYPGVRIVQSRRRTYPFGSAAAHVLGHLGAVEADETADNPGQEGDAYHPLDRIGRTGLERRYEDVLRARRGSVIRRTDHGGRLLSSFREIEPGVGRDLVLTLDIELQRAAEELLESAQQRRSISAGTDADESEVETAGSAVVVMNAHTGELLAAASAPRFDPNWFAGGDSDRIVRLLDDPAHPLFDRVAQMAVPPGSVFKVVASAALLEAGSLRPGDSFHCQGYLHSPDRQRCAIYRRLGVGHGDVVLSDALCASCNVYFFHHAARLGPQPLVTWGRRFGFGRPTGVDLPGEAGGRLPTPSGIRDLEGHDWRVGDTQSLAIGQGSLTATPLQVVRMMAAIANGGRLVTPHLVSRLGLPELSNGQTTADLETLTDTPVDVAAPQPIRGLHEPTLRAIREGLVRVVSDPQGTAHGSVRLDSVSIAGKTGTAETGSGRAEHAWFAGYVPADNPKLAFVVVIEHAGNASETAGPVAKRLVLHLQRLGYLDG